VVVVVVVPAAAAAAAAGTAVELIQRMETARLTKVANAARALKGRAVVASL
jgi:hypothetical protein